MVGDLCQGCHLSLILFITFRIIISRCSQRVEGGFRIWSLFFSDDVVLLVLHWGIFQPSVKYMGWELASLSLKLWFSVGNKLITDSGFRMNCCPKWSSLSKSSLNKYYTYWWWHCAGWLWWRESWARMWIWWFNSWSVFLPAPVVTGSGYQLKRKIKDASSRNDFSLKGVGNRGIWSFRSRSE